MREYLIAEVAGLCEHYRVQFHHSADSRRDLGNGIPDFIIAGPNGIIFRECKSATGSLTPAQSCWKWTLRANRLDWSVWRPADLKSGRIRAEIAALALRTEETRHLEGVGPGTGTDGFRCLYARRRVNYGANCAGGCSWKIASRQKCGANSR